MTRNCKTRAYLMQNFMELDMKKFCYRSQNSDIWRQGPKIQFRAIWAQNSLPEVLLIKSLVKNPEFNFHKQDLIYLIIMRLIQYNHEISKKVLNLGSGAQKLNFGHLGPENISSNRSRTLTPIFTSGPHFLKNHEMNPYSYLLSSELE